jgi:ABC-type glutathione transport system ATPase component
MRWTDWPKAARRSSSRIVLSVARTANLIIVMSKGEIVERGTHEELLALHGHYADLWNQQMLGVTREEVMMRDSV